MPIQNRISASVPADFITPFQNQRSQAKLLKSLCPSILQSNTNAEFFGMFATLVPFARSFLCTGILHRKCNGDMFYLNNPQCQDQLQHSEAHLWQLCFHSDKPSLMLFYYSCVLHSCCHRD